METKPQAVSRDTHKSGAKGLLVGVLIGAAIGGLLMWATKSLIESSLRESHLVQQLVAADAILTAWDLLALPVLILIGVEEQGRCIFKSGILDEGCLRTQFE